MREVVTSGQLREGLVERSSLPQRITVLLLRESAFGRWVHLSVGEGAPPAAFVAERLLPEVDLGDPTARSSRHGNAVLGVLPTLYPSRPPREGDDVPGLRLSPPPIGSAEGATHATDGPRATEPVTEQGPVEQGWEPPIPSPDASFWERLTWLEKTWLGWLGHFLTVRIDQPDIRIDAACAIPRWGEDSLEERFISLAGASGLFAEGSAHVVTTRSLRTGPTPKPPTDLTQEDIETAQLALIMGYYERPKRATLDDLVEAADMAKPWIQSHLQRVERRAVYHLILDVLAEAEETQRTRRQAP